MSQVTVALVGDPAHPGAHVPEEEWDKPWEERRQVKLEVDEGESLGSIAERAYAELGVAPSEHGIATVHVVNVALHGEGGRIVGFSALVDDDTRIVWSAHDLRLIPYDQLVRSVEAGVVGGDPERLYLILKEPIGNGLGLDWPTIVQAWDVAWAVAEKLAAAGGAAWFLDQVRRRLSRGKTVVERNMHRWDQRGAWPHIFARSLHKDAWDAQQLAGLLGCPQEDAEAVLALLGYAYNEADRLWYPEGDEPGRLLAATFDEIELAAIDFEEGRRDEFVNRLGELLRTGERLPEPSYEPEYEQADLTSDVSQIHVVSSRSWEPCPVCGDEIGSPNDDMMAFDERLNHLLEHGLRVLHVGTDSSGGPGAQATVAVLSFPE